MAQYPSLYNTKLERLLAQATDLWRFGTTGLETFETRHKAANRIQKDYPIPDLGGTLAIYSGLQSVAMAESYFLSRFAHNHPTVDLDAQIGRNERRFYFVAGRSEVYRWPSSLYYKPTSCSRLTKILHRPYGFVSDMYLLERSKKREIKRTTLETKVG